jgi:antitoxin ParD1/3/4
MPRRTISLTPDQDAFVDNLLKAGEYRNASEAVGYALRLLRQRRSESASKLKALRTQITAGVEDLERGDFIEVEAEHLKGCLDGLAAKSTGSR